MRPTSPRTGAWRWLVPRKVGAAAARASTASWRTLDGPLPKRPSPGRRSPGRTGVVSDMRPLYPRPTSHFPDGGKPVPRISRRVAAIAESATLVIDAKAKALKAAGEDVIGFGAGEPDFPTPHHIVEAAVAACSEPRYHHYTPGPGLPELRAAIAAETVVVETDKSTGFRVGVEQLEAATTDRTKLLVFVSPSNPTGAVYPREEVEAIGRWAAGRGLWVLTDEIYEHLVYGDAEFSSMPAVVPELADRCVVVNGVAKTYAMTGWRVGWLIGPPDVVKAAINLQSHATSNVANVSQAAALAAVSGDLVAVDEMRAAFDRRRRKMVELLRAIPGVTCVEPEGAFYAFPSLEAVLGRELRGQRPATTMELADLILEEVKVAIVPGEAFGAPGYARLSYALGDDDLVEGVTRIAKLLAEARPA